MRRTFVIFALLAGNAFAGLTEIRTEQNLERRAKLALENADSALTAARESYKKQEMAETSTNLKELEDSVELARESLVETGRDPRRRPKAFKSAENRTREILRRLDSLENDMDLDDRKLLDGAKMKLKQANEEWLLGIMTGRKKGDR